MSIRTTVFAIGALAAVSACNSEPTTPTDNALSPAFNHSGTGNTVVVTETDISRQAEDTPPTDNWVLYFRPTGSAAFRNGPGSPPLGSGSFEMITPDPVAKFSLFNFEYLNTQVSDFTALGYHTYQTSATPSRLRFPTQPSSAASAPTRVAVVPRSRPQWTPSWLA